MNVNIDEMYVNEYLKIAGNTFDTTLQTLREATDRRLKQPFYVRGYRGKKGEDDEISVDPKNYQSTQFLIGSLPVSDTGYLYKNVEFGYKIFNHFRAIGFLNYILVSKEDDSILEVGFGGEEVRTCFLYHLRGRTLSPEQRERIRIIQETTFLYLRENKMAQEKLLEFAKKRKWPVDLENSAHLAYFDDRITPLKQFAKEQGFTDEEMYLAGWFDISFSLAGELDYQVRDMKVIRIPFFKDGRIEVWRTRNLRASRETSHKYTSWPLDRSIERTMGVEEILYNGWRLNEVKGKTLVLTEGEFKCLVATHMSDILTVGIPGITEVNKTIIDALVQAQAAEYIVILDRDPRGKGFMRIDGITDSERAAYGIALDLIQAGAKNVRIGLIPDVKNGQKVGLDDLILEKGVDSLYKVIERALEPSYYAKAINLSETFFLLIQARQKIKKALEQYHHSERRGGMRIENDIYEEAIRLKTEISTLYDKFLLEKFRGGYRIDQPSRDNLVLFRCSSIADIEKKIAMDEKGKGYPLERFVNDIIFFQYYPLDIPRNVLYIGKNDLTLPFLMEEITQLFETGQTENEDLLTYFQQGKEILEKETFQTKHDLAEVLLAGYLCQDFPVDEYLFVPGLTLYVDCGDYWSEHIRIPLAIFKKETGDAIAFSTLSLWESEEEASESLMFDNRIVVFATSFLRRKDTFFDEKKFRMVVETLYPYWFKKNFQTTLDTMGYFGVTKEIVEKHKLLFLSRADCEELIDHFLFRRLLNQAAFSGFFYIEPYKKFRPRFESDIIVLPVFDENFHIVSFRVFPLTIGDHSAFDPCEKIIHQIDGGDRHLLPAMNPGRHLYMQHRLSKVKDGKTLVAYHELDGLMLRSRYKNVISLNHSLTLHEDILRKIRISKPESLYFVFSGEMPHSKYDDFDHDGIPGFLKEIYDIQKGINPFFEEHTIQIFFTVLPFPLSHLTVEEELSEEMISAIFQSCVFLKDYLTARKFNSANHGIIKHFLEVNNRFLDYLEIQAFPDMLDSRTIEWWIKENKRLYQAIENHVMKVYHKELPNLNVFFQKKLNLETSLAIEELVRQRNEEKKLFFHKPMYSQYKERKREIRDAFHWLLQTTLFDRQTISLQSIESIIHLPEIEEKKSVKKEKPPIEEDHTFYDKPKDANAKGRLLSFYQKQPSFFSTIEILEECSVGKGFSIILQMTSFEQDITVIGRGTALRKKDAEAIACESILEEFEHLGIKVVSKEPEKSQDNPKSEVYSLLQKEKNYLLPEIDAKMLDNLFHVSVKISYKDQWFSSGGKGKTKKEAEREAFSLLLKKMTAEQLLPFKFEKNEMEKIKEILDINSKDYVGRVYRISRTIDAKPPQMITTYSFQEEETLFKTVIQFSFSDGSHILTEAQASSNPESRQQAAFALLIKLSEMINEKESA